MVTAVTVCISQCVSRCEPACILVPAPIRAEGAGKRGTLVFGQNVVNSSRSEFFFPGSALQANVVCAFCPSFTGRLGIRRAVARGGGEKEGGDCKVLYRRRCLMLTERIRSIRAAETADTGDSQNTHLAQSIVAAQGAPNLPAPPACSNARTPNISCGTVEAHRRA